jgi:hypothetical protein
MQFEGGYRYPSNKILLVLTVMTLVVVSFIWWWKGLSFLDGASLLLGLEGTVLLASAYSPVGLVPPQGSFFRVLRWVFTPQKGMVVSFNQPMFYGGLLCLFLSYVAAVSGP